MTRRLLIFANAFPFGTWEPYLVEETGFYGDFDEVYIFSLSVRESQLTTRRRLRDDRIRVVQIPKLAGWRYAVMAPGQVVNPALWREVRTLLERKRMTPKRLVKALVFFTRADHEARVIRRFIRNQIDQHPNDKTTLYAYRFMYQPYLAKKVSSAVRNPRLVGRAHGSDLYEELAPLGYLPMRRESASVLDVLATVSEHGRDYLLDSSTSGAEKTVVSRLGTVDRGFAPPVRIPELVRIASCSTVTPVKRLSLVVDALRLLSGSVAVEWVHYGDGPLMDELELQVKDLPPNVSVDFKGHVPNECVLEAYASGAHDLLINVSESEGVPVSIMEALSFGVPVIATDAGGNSEIVVTGENGTLLGTHPRAEEVAGAILDLRGLTEADYSELTARARRSWESSYDAATNYTTFASEVLIGSESAVRALPQGCE